MEIEKLITNGEGTIVDVRTPAEFMGGHVAGSINIPLNELPARMVEIKKLTAPVIFCCASGNRSGQATQFAAAQGILCVNGGSWTTVNYYKSLHPQMEG